MKIQDMFEKDITRNINGVIKVAQDDEQSLLQELNEYIITKELRKHFTTFFDVYSKAIEQPTDKVGVWISGFFGSGKSHFLKILSYLLSNREVAGKHAVDIFKDKFDDPMTYATLVRCTQIPAESILFNIDIEGKNKDKTAVLRVFAKMFYEHLGYYGDDLKIAKLEQYLAKEGKTEMFHAAFEKKHGKSWLDSRSSYAFLADTIVAVLQNVLNMSETAARNWFNDEIIPDLSIRQLVDEIKEYVDSRGKDFRLLFCVDEVGQYIGEDGDLMLNLQSIVEQVGDKCRGKVWIMVTSQEAIDSVVKIKGDDFSKIQGRFNTRLSLSSASVDEVIKKRVLKKTVDADSLLQSVYAKEQAALKNLFTFTDAIRDIKGYADSDEGGGREFSATYPFVPYQFIILQKVFAEIRKHGNAGKHLSGGERSMLSGFKEATQGIMEKDENALVPFYQFYDTIHTFLESTIRQVIDRCQTAAENRDGLEPQDVTVLKLLYLIRYITDIPANLDNLTTLMIDDIHAEKFVLRNNIFQSLHRLLSQNYIAKNDDVYSFLTDEEQDIARDIHNMPVDTAAIVQKIGEIVFADIYPSKKYKLDKYDFDYDSYIDETRIGTATGAIRLQLLTTASDYYYSSKEKLKADSRANNEVIIVLSPEQQYFEELEQATKIQKYVKQKNVSQLPENIQNIIRKHQTHAHKLEDNAKESIKKAIVNGAFFIHGEKVEMPIGGDAKAKLDEAMNRLVTCVYTKLRFVNVSIKDDDDILHILKNPPDIDGVSSFGVNTEALSDMSQWLEMQYNRHVPVTMGNVQKRYQAIPYGWREVDIAAIMASLIVNQKVSIKYGGAIVSKDDRRLVNFLRRKNEIEKTSVIRRIAPSEDLMRKTITFMREWSGQMDIPENEDDLLLFILNKLKQKQIHYGGLIEHEYSHDSYPEKEHVTAIHGLLTEFLSKSNDNVALLTCLIQKQDTLRNLTDDMEAVETFFKSQRSIFDAARLLQKELKDERHYFVTDIETCKKIDELINILNLPKPYVRIKELPELSQIIKTSYRVLLERKKKEVHEIISQYLADIPKLEGADRASDIVGMAKKQFEEYSQEVTKANRLIQLDAMKSTLQAYNDTVCSNIGSFLYKPDASSVNNQTKLPKIVQIRRYDIFPVKHIQTHEDIDNYLSSIKKKLYETLDANDGIQLN
jgi:hypothetical protein